MSEPKKQKRPRTIGRYSKEQHEAAAKKGYALVHVEVNDAYLPDEDGSNFSSHGPATPAFAQAIRDVMDRFWNGEFRQSETATTPR